MAQNVCWKKNVLIIDITFGAENNSAKRKTESKEGRIAYSFPGSFNIAEIQKKFPGVSVDMIRRVGVE